MTVPLVRQPALLVARVRHAAGEAMESLSVWLESASSSVYPRTCGWCAARLHEPHHLGCEWAER